MSGGGPGRLLEFRLGRTGAALPLGMVREVVRHPQVVPVPGSHSFVRGVALQDGMALPVYDLGRFEPLWSGGRPAGQAAGGDEDHLIVCEWGEVTLGVLGSRVDVVEEVPDDGGAEGPGQTGAVNSAYVRRTLRLKGDLIALLDADRLFASLGVPAAQPRKEGSP